MNEPGRESLLTSSYQLEDIKVIIEKETTGRIDREGTDMRVRILTEKGIRVLLENPGLLSDKERSNLIAGIVNPGFSRNLPYPVRIIKEGFAVELSEKLGRLAEGLRNEDQKSLENLRSQLTTLKTQLAELEKTAQDLSQEKRTFEEAINQLVKDHPILLEDKKAMGEIATILKTRDAFNKDSRDLSKTSKIGKESTSKSGVAEIPPEPNQIFERNLLGKYTKARPLDFSLTGFEDRIPELNQEQKTLWQSTFLEKLVNQISETNFFDGLMNLDPQKFSDLPEGLYKLIVQINDNQSLLGRYPNLAVDYRRAQILWLLRNHGGEAIIKIIGEEEWKKCVSSAIQETNSQETFKKAGEEPQNQLSDLQQKKARATEKLLLNSQEKEELIRQIKGFEAKITQIEGKSWDNNVIEAAEQLGIPKTAIGYTSEGKTPTINLSHLEQILPQNSPIGKLLGQIDSLFLSDGPYRRSNARAEPWVDFLSMLPKTKELMIKVLEEVIDEEITDGRFKNLVKTSLSQWRKIDLQKELESRNTENPGLIRDMMEYFFRKWSETVNNLIRRRQGEMADQKDSWSDERISPLAIFYPEKLLATLLDNTTPNFVLKNSEELNNVVVNLLGRDGTRYLKYIKFT